MSTPNVEYTGWEKDMATVMDIEGAQARGMSDKEIHQAIVRFYNLNPAPAIDEDGNEVPHERGTP